MGAERPSRCTHAPRGYKWLSHRRKTIRGYRYAIGIDLGTTNSAVAYVDLAKPAGADGPSIQFFDIPQLVAASELTSRPVLPSFAYLPGEHDLPDGATALPWDPERDYVVGEFARDQGANVPGRLVSSAKSWLSHAGVDRTAAILPWGADETIDRISPVAASRRYLQHIAEGWNARMAPGRDNARFEDQLIVLTVPASFDEVARELTVQAAEAAGIHNAVLLEEPLAAFYAWLSRHERDWQTQVQDGQLILVCDIGGGTTDFSVVAVSADSEGEEGGVKLNRLAVGDHLLLGGDNMDLTLGRHVETQLMGQPGKLDQARWRQVVHRCRQAKEQLLADAGPDSADITVVSGGSSLIAGTLKASITNQEVHELILDGFFPETTLATPLVGSTRAGLTELGLPYVQDPAVTRHLAAFWRRVTPLLQEETGRPSVYPDFLLFNGGAMTPPSLRQRLIEIVGGWFEDEAGASWRPEQLANPRPELAVAIGASYYGLVRLGHGVRIGSGSPRAYYVNVETGSASNGVEHPGVEHPGAEHRGVEHRGVEHREGVCLVPRGAQEGLDIRLATPVFEALANQPVAFQVFTSDMRVGDEPGDVVSLPEDETVLLPTIRTVLRYGRRNVATQIPVQLAVRLNEIGTLEIWCESRNTDHRWRLEFDVRGEAEEAQDDEPAADDDNVSPQKIEAAQAAIRATFDRATTPQNPPEQLRKRIEAQLELPKEEWPATTIRQLADTFLTAADERAISFQHETFWLNLLSYCMRPGFGDPADELRMKHIWSIYLKGLTFGNKVQNRSEWWVFWRRAAAGFAVGKQLQIYEQVAPSLRAVPEQRKQKGQKRSKKGSKQGGRVHLGAAEALEVWMMLANFERLPVEVKTKLGRQLLETLRKKQPQAKELWALSRFGARETAYGPLDRVIVPGEAEGWLEVLLQSELEPTSGSAHALVHLAQFTGDRTRDISPAMRGRVEAWLQPLSNADTFVELLNDPLASRSDQEQEWIFGETLPLGLVLRREDG